MLLSNPANHLQTPQVYLVTPQISYNMRFMSPSQYNGGFVFVGPARLFLIIQITIICSEIPGQHGNVIFNNTDTNKTLHLQCIRVRAVLIFQRNISKKQTHVRTTLKINASMSCFVFQKSIWKMYLCINSNSC